MRKHRYRNEQIRRSCAEVYYCTRHFRIVYRLFKKRMPHYPYRVGDIYSLMITKTDLDSGVSEREYIYDFSRNEAEAHRIFCLVRDGLVTPDSAAEAVSDLISIPFDS